MYISRRLHPRIEVPLRATMNGVDAEIMDISMGGCRLLVASSSADNAFQADMMFRCTMQLPSHPQDPLQLDAIITRRTDGPNGQEFATRFVDIADHDRVRLAPFIETSLTEALGAAQRARVSFLHGMSHEIRTPLNAIIGLSQLGAATTEFRSAPHGYFEDISRAGAQMLEFLDSLLRIAACEADIARGNAMPKVTRIAPLLSEMAAAVMNTAGREQVSIHTNIPSCGPQTLMALDPLREIVNALLRGAVSQTGSFGRVFLSCSSKKDEGRPQVRIGIRPHLRHSDSRTVWSAADALGGLYLTAASGLAESAGVELRRIPANTEERATDYVLVLPDPLPPAAPELERIAV